MLIIELIAKWAGYFFVISLIMVTLLMLSIAILHKFNKDTIINVLDNILFKGTEFVWISFIVFTLSGTLLKLLELIYA